MLLGHVLWFNAILKLLFAAIFNFQFPVSFPISLSFPILTSTSKMAPKILKRRTSSVGRRQKGRSSSVPDRWRSYRSKKKTDALLCTFNGPPTGPPSEAPSKVKRVLFGDEDFKIPNEGLVKKVTFGDEDRVRKRVSYIDLQPSNRGNVQIASDKVKKYLNRTEVVRSTDLWWVVYFFKNSHIQPLLWSVAFVCGFFFSDWNGWLNVDQIKLSIDRIPHIKYIRSGINVYTFGLPLVLDPLLFSICFLIVSMVQASMVPVEKRIVLFEETF